MTDPISTRSFVLASGNSMTDDPIAVSDESRRLVYQATSYNSTSGYNPHPNVAALLARIADIEAERDDAIDSWAKQAEQATGIIAALRAELEEARKDTERLDWLNRLEFCKVTIDSIKHYVECESTRIREAIDTERVDTGKTE